MTTPELAGGLPRNDDTVLVRGINHLLAVVPHLIGYRPDHSLVVVATRLEGTRHGVHRGSVAFAARVDLPPPTHLPQLPHALGGPLRRVASEGGQLMLHTFGYDLPTGPDGEVDAGYAEALLQTLESTARRAGAELHDLDLVRDQGREHRRLLVATCRTEEPWQPVPPAADVPAAADFVLQGRAPLPSREVVAAAVRRRDETAAARTDLALTLLAADPAKLDRDVALRALGAWVVHGSPSPGARERAWITAELHDRQVRDALLGRWLPQMFDLHDVLGPDDAALLARWVPPWPREDSDAALDRLLELAAKVPVQLGAPVVTVAAFVAWVHGQGTVANEACDLALEVDPDYRMAVLLRECLDRGIKPTRDGADRQERRARRRGSDTAA
ncbi:DUF4192 domain-containing protein [Ornithinimicrobium pratense]|uniref:DUF4192 family protein n=1 Tax=Ornithinimicrobium pratense TaxID=2593973 RepID=A0A5J6V4M5_9MICO|nr:DUF4192 domain-containing protein [Ornithinimicrobium pratense]QFG68126.1 DUF4192 family protein [Ornithinimicrobium pratense]